MPEPQTPFVDLPHEYANPPLAHLIEDGRAWTLATLDPSECIIALDDTARAEVLTAAREIADNPLPDLARTPDQFGTPNLRAAMKKIGQLLKGPGLGVIDRLPIDEIGDDIARTIYWVIGQMIGRPVAQRWDGTMVFDVADSGTKPGAGTRDSATNLELLFHTDNGFNITLPDTVSLLCIHQARGGGVSRFASLYSLHNRFLERYREHLKRLYQPVLFDRKAEHAAGEPKVLRAPVFQWDGARLTARPNAVYIRQGYELAGIELDPGLSDALDALAEVASDPDLWVEMRMERGQLQYLNNRQLVHYRSAFTDFEEPDRKRRVVRIWYRDAGRPTYNG